MSEYRLYFYDRGRSLVFLKTLVCADDVAAIKCSADKHYDGRAMELWDRSRKVADFGVKDRRRFAGSVVASPRQARPMALATLPGRAFASRASGF
jgi:hypothetical protein